MFSKILPAIAFVVGVAWAGPAAAQVQDVLESAPAKTTGAGQSGTSAKPRPDAHQSVPLVPDVHDVVLPATITLECDGKDYEISTGDDKGHCQRDFEDGKKTAGATCYDDKGKQRSTATCSGGCGTSAGGGSCKVSRH